QANPHLESLLSSAHVTRVEAAIWESLGVEDRLAFYDSEGVIRDVMQNHLTEMLSLLLMDLPPSEPPPPDWLESEKSRLLAAYCPLLGERHLLAGRYAGFGGSSATPTFAAAGLTVCRSARWQSLPIFASAGKRLAFKASFIRLRFQLATERTEDELLVFVGGDAKATGLARPLIACSSGLRCRPSAGLSVLPSNEAALPSGKDAAETESLLRFPTDRYAFFSAVSEQESQNSYVAVVRQLLRSSSESPINSCFVGLPSLLASWRLWDPALAAVADLAELDDEDSGSTANLIRLDPAVCNGASDCEFLLHRGSPLSLSRQLAFRIAPKVKEAFVASTATVYGQKNQFHLALPGGQSAQMLMQFLAALSRDDDTLANAFATTLHIWVTDERCVHDDPGSVTQNESQLNSAVIDRNFLQQLPSAARLPLNHLHFPRLLAADVAGCRAAAGAYASEVDHWLNFRSNISALPPSFDFVVLGVGTDGHVASLFSPHDLDKWDRSMPISSAEDQLSQGYLRVLAKLLLF
uniref:Glucose-6-phosphate 1-dehydrogenase n=1 Tax=Macrostomum lignano TaxID=282301 RepID=A0A1I8HJD4_9PLAT